MISVIVPFKSGVHFLEDCLQSLLEQTYKDFEVLIVCNGQADSIDELVKKFQSQITLRVFQEECASVGHARNVGMREAKGEFIYFIDADDYINADVLEKLYQAIELEQADFAYGLKTKTWLKKTSYESIKQEEAETKAVTKEAEFMKSIAGESEEVQRSKHVGFRFFYVKKTIALISALHVLVRTSFVKQHHLSFYEDVTLCSDLSFVMKMITSYNKCAYAKDAFYAKRNHNDPIHYPALIQESSADKFRDCFDAYDYVVEQLKIPADHPMTKELQRQMMAYIALVLMPKVVEEKKKVWKEEYLPRMEHILEGIDTATIRKMSGYEKRLGLALHKNNTKKALRIGKMHQLGARVNLIFTKKNFLKTMIYKRFLKLPMKDNWVLFETFRGKSYSDSPKYIYEYLAKTYPGEYKYVWAINDFKGKLPYGGKVVTYRSLGYFYYMARAKFFISNTRQPKEFIKRKGAKFLSTWHGTPLKRLVFDQDDVAAASPLYKQQFYYHAKEWDYLVSPNDFSTNVFESAFMCDRDKIVPCGYPRNDILYTRNNQTEITKIKDKLGIPKNKKVILYAPTWRDDQFVDYGAYLFTLELDLKLLKEKLKEDYVLVLRTHYYIANKIDIRGVEDFVFNASDYDDISELYLISDILITDYSSVFFDYGNLKRPMLFFTYDLDKYRDVLRGFYLDMEKDLPGPLLETSEQVVDAILNIDAISKKYESTYETFYQRFCHLDDGHASERIAELVFKGNDFRA